MRGAKGGKYTVTEGDETLGGEHRMQYTDDVLYRTAHLKPV